MISWTDSILLLLALAVIGYVVWWLGATNPRHKKAAKAWVREWIDLKDLHGGTLNPLGFCYREIRIRGRMIITHALYEDALEATEKRKSALPIIRFLQLQHALAIQGFGLKEQLNINKTFFPHILYWAFSNARPNELPELFLALRTLGTPNYMYRDHTIGAWQGTASTACNQKLDPQIFDGILEIIDWVDRHDPGTELRHLCGLKLMTTEQYDNLLKLYGGRDKVPADLLEPCDRRFDQSTQKTDERLRALIDAKNWKAIAFTIENMGAGSTRGQWLEELFEHNQKECTGLISESKPSQAKP